jgi:hypothetical protein
VCRDNVKAPAEAAIKLAVPNIIGVGRSLIQTGLHLHLRSLSFERRCDLLPLPCLCRQPCLSLRDFQLSGLFGNDSVRVAGIDALVVSRVHKYVSWELELSMK